MFSGRVCRHPFFKHPWIVATIKLLIRHGEENENFNERYNHGNKSPEKDQIQNTETNLAKVKFVSPKASHEPSQKCCCKSVSLGVCCYYCHRAICLLAVTVGILFFAISKKSVIAFIIHNLNFILIVVLNKITAIFFWIERGVHVGVAG